MIRHRRELRQEFNTLPGPSTLNGSMSGVINVVSQEGPDHYTGRSPCTDRYGIDKYDNNTKQGDFGVGDPCPSPAANLRSPSAATSADGYIYGAQYPNWTVRSRDVDSITGLPQVIEELSCGPAGLSQWIRNNHVASAGNGRGILRVHKPQTGQPITL
jgi:hypothetical protein